jgi:16S rRNA (guanine1207-N2)-methyltransferase
MLHSSLLRDTVRLAPANSVLILNSASDPFVLEAARVITTGQIVLAEDSVAALHQAQAHFAVSKAAQPRVRHVPFHEYTLHEAPATINVAVINTLYQPGNDWMRYALQLAAYALAPGGRLYVQGAKDRGVLSLAKHMQALFGNVETLEISKGERVVSSHLGTQWIASAEPPLLLNPFAGGQLDEGTRLLIEALDVRVTDVALDIGSGAGYLGLEIARIASKGQVTMVDASLAAVSAARRAIEESGLRNIQVLASDGAQEVMAQRFDLVVTNPPFHIGGIQTKEVAERFIREAARVLRPRGRFYLVANRFLKYEPTMRECFKMVEEVTGNTKFKALRGMK